MSDYIKKEDAIDILNGFEEEAGNRGDTEVEGTCMLARNAVIDLPSADVEEVVRCKDCKYWHKGDAAEFYCGHEHGLVYETVPSDYCSYGERKDD